MSLFSKTEIKDNKNAVITVGDANLISVSQKLAEMKETSITSQRQEWSEIFEQITQLQKIVTNLADENEELRDEHLVPTLSKAKKEAKNILDNPTASKKAFLENFKEFCDFTLKVTGVAKLVSPFVTKIAELLGIILL
jgi:vacuolar-type H+-ATPase subunit H